MRSAVDALLFVIENPALEKAYREFKNYYASRGMPEQAEAVDTLMRHRFNGTVNNDVHPVPQRPAGG
jgi:hypothetical protein